MIKMAKESDKKYNRECELITEDEIKSMWANSKACHYCDVIMQCENRRADDGVTLERLDNTIGHCFSNCVLACWKCNIKVHNKKRFMPAEALVVH